ncbi:hypothetical protein GCM10009760_52360 [Kitasatospora kazusensis]|uniref:Uncharacterized protein n=1 Tax=Kitasatospora kazusensis TaxID=407974 RepID=A0ABN3A4T1_9ACTN
MRVERTLLAGAAVAAVLALGSPIAYADTAPAPKSATVDDQKVWQDQPSAADEQKAGADKPGADKPAADKPPAEKPAADKPATDKKVVKEDAKKDDGKKEEVNKDDAKKDDGKKEDDSAKGGKETSDEADAPWQEDQKPHGGVHTGGGALSVSGGGLASGAALLAGGIGVGAYALRRRGSATGSA